MRSQRIRIVAGYGYSSKGSRASAVVPRDRVRRCGRCQQKVAVRKECGTLRIGDHVAYDGRCYVVLGLDPMGVPGRRVDLEDLETGERLRIPAAELEPARD
jgi:hypothetical protein